MYFNPFSIPFIRISLLWVLVFFLHHFDFSVVVFCLSSRNRSEYYTCRFPIASDLIGPARLGKHFLFNEHSMPNETGMFSIENVMMKLTR